MKTSTLHNLALTFFVSVSAAMLFSFVRMEGPERQKRIIDRNHQTKLAVRQYIQGGQVQAKVFPWHDDGRFSFEVLQDYLEMKVITEEEYNILSEKPMVIWQRPLPKQKSPE